MLNFEKYTYIKKSKFEVASDNIVRDLSSKLWKDSGYYTAYLLGIVNYIKSVIDLKGESVTTTTLLQTIIALKNSDDTPAEIKSLIDLILKENKND